MPCIALLRLGYPLSSQRRRQLWCRVDLDKSGAGAQLEADDLVHFAWL